MVKLDICRRCSKCFKLYPSVYDEKGKLIGLPSVSCCLVKEDGSGISLTGDSKLPPDCIYLAEQIMCEQDARDDFEDMMESMSKPEEQ